MDAIQQQRDIDLAFGDLEQLLDAERQTPFERNNNGAKPTRDPGIRARIRGCGVDRGG